MGSFTNADAFRLWTLALFLAVVLVVLSVVAICIFLWRNRPEGKDSLRLSRVEKRLSELAEAAPVKYRESA
jgi:hypothetical protein